MILELVRYCYGPESTLGLLKFGPHSVWTVEKPWRDNQVFQSCIPDGSYPLQAFDSKAHPRCWVITPVPGRTGILIHPGNTVRDVSGCIAPGLEYSGMTVRNSREAMRLLNYVLDRKEQHTIHIGPGMGARMIPDDGQADDSEPNGGNGADGGDMADVAPD